MQIVKQGSRVDYNYKEIYIDTIEEKDTIEIKDLCPGSLLYVIDSGDIYILNSKKEWVIQN